MQPVNLKNNHPKTISCFFEKWGGVVLIILISILAYGVFVPWLSRYMDDWEHTFSFYHYGADGMIYYFKQSRPLLGSLYRLNITLLHNNALLFHLFALLWRTLGSLAFYALVYFLWPTRKNLALFAGLLFAVYPGYLLQPISFTMAHNWIVFTIFLVSNCFTVLAFRLPGKKWLFSILAILFSLANILLMEYFLPLEVIRLFILLILISGTQRFIPRLIKAFSLWIPYLACLIGVSIFRVFFYSDQTHIYPMGLVETFKLSFRSGLLQLSEQFIDALYQSVIQAWIQPFQGIIQQIGSSRTFLGVMLLVVFLITTLTFILMKSRKSENSKIDWSPLIISLISLCFAGIPFYLTLLPVEAVGLNSRFTMPYMVGTCLLFAFLLDLIPVHIMKCVLASTLIAFAVGFQLLNENSFRLMADKYKNIMYQIAWRAPDLNPGTLIITNELDDSHYYNFSNLRNMFNLAYPSDISSQYDWVFGRELASRYNIVENMSTDTKPYDRILKDYQNGIVVFQLEENGCVRFIETGSELINPEIVGYGFEKLSDSKQLIVDPEKQVQIDPIFIGKEPTHGWCYYFEKADLAIQQKDYESVADYYQKVIEGRLWTRQSLEWLPFIEGLAGSGDWTTALSLSQKIIKKNPDIPSVNAFICKRLLSVAPTPESILFNQAEKAMITLGCK